MTGERAGIPSVSVMTDRFVSAAEVMRASLGAPDHDFVVIPHPISSATPSALERIARTAATEIAVLLTSDQDGSDG